MGKLAINGGKAVRAKSAKWPQWPISDESEVKLLTQITRSNRWSFDGPTEWKFAEAFTKYQGAKYGMCVANGTVGIQLALEALGVGAYDEVIVPGLTWQATAAAVADVNAVPVLTDVEPDTWCLDLAQVEKNITRKTKAVVVVHLYGCVPDITKLQSLCKKRNLFLVEDCAHQHGTFWKGKGVGSFGDVSSWSFQESKVLSSGEGGFNMCKTQELFERLYSLRNCGRGWQGDMNHAVQSGNYRITEWQAGILWCGLQRLDKQVKHRDANAMYLNKRLAEIPGILPMRRRKEVTQQSYFNFTFRLDVEALGGLTNREIGEALNAELSLPGGWEPPYQPLNNCSLYKPRTKPRHKLNAEYWKKLDPRGYRLPVCKDAHERSGLSIHHAALMGSRKDMDDIANALEKIVENADELRAKKPAKRKAFLARARW